MNNSVYGHLDKLLIISYFCRWLGGSADVYLYRK